MPQEHVVLTPERRKVHKRTITPSPPFVKWDKSRRTLTITLHRVDYERRRIPSTIRESFCDLHIPSNANEYSVGDPINGYFIVGFSLYAPIASNLTLAMLQQWDFLYRLAKFAHNNFRRTHEVAYLLRMVEAKHPSIFGPFRNDLWRLIEKYNLRVHIPLP